MNDSIRERFMSKVDKGGDDGCWIWTGACDPSGYGRFWITENNKKRQYAHRISFELHFRPLEQGEVAHHKCANRGCVNPEHLEATSQAGNVAEALLRRQFDARIQKLEDKIVELEEALSGRE
jgi:hypothetical protein